MRLGTFTLDSFGEMHGKICGLGLGVTPVVFQQQTSRDGNLYFKAIADPVGEAFDIGAAFEREKDGKKYYAVYLESPAFAAPVNAVLLPDREYTGTYNLIWDRPVDTNPKLEVVLNGGLPKRKFVGAAAAP